MPDQLGALGTYFSQQQPLVNTVRDFSGTLQQFDGFAGGLDVGQWWQSKTLISGQHAVQQLVNAYGQIVSAASYYGDRRIFGEGTASTPFAQSALDAVWVLTAAAMGRGAGQLDLGAGMRLAFGGDPASQTFRSVILGLPWPGDPGNPDDPGGFFPPYPQLPSVDQISLAQLNRITCYGSLAQALGEVSTAGATFRRSVLYPGMTITGIKPVAACPGDTVHISGTGFGAAEPPDAVVVFGSTRASVVPGSWTATGFDVVVPANAGVCCVSILQVPTATTGFTGTLDSALGDLAGVLSECFGTTGIAIGGRLDGIKDRLPDNQSAICAADGSNRFLGGPPGIAIFRTAAGTASPQSLSPGDTITLQWSLSNATSASLVITPDASNPPYAITPTLPSWFSADPTAGTVTLPTTTGLVPWKITITLSARNACGTTRRALEIDFKPETGLIFVGGGMRTSFHLGAIDALGAILPIAPTVYSGTGLGALSAVCAAADYPTPATLRTFWDDAVSHDSWYVVSSAFPVGGDSLALWTARWQSEARAEVMSLGALQLIRNFLLPIQQNDPRLVSALFALVASKAADKVVDALGDALTQTLLNAGLGVLSYVPILEILYDVAKYGFTLYEDSRKQDTINTLSTLPSVFDNSRLMALTTTALAGVDARVTEAGRIVRIPLTSLELGRARYGTEFGSVSDPPVTSNVVATGSGLLTLVQASATIPLLGGPVKIGTDNYMDGSLRDPVPIGATFEAGAKTIIIIQPNNRLIMPYQSFDQSGMPSIDVRTSAVHDAQFLDAAIEPFGRFMPDATGAPVGSWRGPVLTIEPSVDLLGLGASFGELGLVNIMSDYGYMRAYDRIVPWILFPDATDPTQTANRVKLQIALLESTDTIVGLRVASWEAEVKFNGMRATPVGDSNLIQGGPLVAVPDDSAITDIRSFKTQIHDALVTRLAMPPATYPVPPVPKPTAESWYLGWESYAFYQVVAPTTVMSNEPNGDPWVSLSYTGYWTVPAATPPAKLWP